MANYIQKLKNENFDLKKQIENAKDAIHNHQKLLSSPKFIGYDSDGDRKDWIAISDSNRFCESVLEKLNH